MNILIPKFLFLVTLLYEKLIRILINATLADYQINLGNSISTIKNNFSKILFY